MNGQEGTGGEIVEGMLRELHEDERVLLWLEMHFESDAEGWRLMPTD